MEQKTAPGKRGRKPAAQSPAVNAGTSYQIKKKEVKKSTSFNKEEVIECKIVPVAVQESKLTTPTLKELKEWKDFLKAEGLYYCEEESSYL